MATRRKRTSSARTSRSSSAGKKRAGNSNRVGLWLVGGATVLVVLVIVLVSTTQSPAAVDAEKYADLPDDWINRNVLGDPDAPVTIQTWEDFL